MKQPVTYLSPCGMLGYGFPSENLSSPLLEELDFIGVDAGSTDPGPYYLGSGKGFVGDRQVRRDLEYLLLAARAAGIPLIIGSAGGAGARPHVDAFVHLLKELSSAHGLHYTLAVINSDISRDLLKRALAEQRIEPCGAAPELTEERIDRVCNPVAQFGVEPIVDALREGAEVIVCGRCCDTAVFAAYPIWKGFDPGLALHAAKIAECGTLCATPPAANDSLVCRIYADHFIVEPVHLERACTPDSVAAHSLYEQPDPECFFEPEGMIDMRASVFEALSRRAVRVSGTTLVPPPYPTVKLEGAERQGYRAISLAGVTDPMVIKHIDDIEQRVRRAVEQNLGGAIPAEAYTLLFRRYGLDAVPFGRRPPFPPPAEIGVLIDVVARSREEAETLVGLARSTMLHQSFPGRKTTAGNLAFPFSPSDIPAGEVYAFSLYHLLRTVPPDKLSAIRFHRL